MFQGQLPAWLGTDGVLDAIKAESADMRLEAGFVAHTEAALRQISSAVTADGSERKAATLAAEVVAVTNDMQDKFPKVSIPLHH